MKRQNIDGKPIFSNQIWRKMQSIGKILKLLEYNESAKNPNLFYKDIFDEDKEIRIFADLRGTEYDPIWSDFKLRLYSYDNDKLTLIFEAIKLKRFTNDIPIEIDNFHDIYVSELDGICKTCGKDILELKKNKIKHLNDKENIKVELQYCDDCKQDIYNQIKKKRRKQKIRNRRKKLCPICKMREKELTHHIRYIPEEKIDICKNCHNIIHHHYGYPNPLWKQRDPKPKERKKKIRRKNFQSFKKLYIILEKYRISDYSIPLSEIKTLSKLFMTFSDFKYSIKKEFSKKKNLRCKMREISIVIKEYMNYLYKYIGPKKFKIHNIEIDLLALFKENFNYINRQALKFDPYQNKTELLKITNNIIKIMNSLKTKLDWI